MPITVTTTADTINPSDGVTSLREAINDANASAGNDEIVIAASLLTNGPSIMTLGSAALPTIAATSKAGSLVITGPGASSLIISGDNGNPSRNFGIFNIASGGNLSISGMTVSGANITGNGGAFANAGSLTVSNSTISGNTASNNGGGIYNTGTLTVNNSTISNNSSGFAGGGIRISGGIVTVTNSTISLNTSLFSAGTDGLTVTNI
jgi:CSLREA domain-containing protein